MPMFVPASNCQKPSEGAEFDPSQGLLVTLLMLMWPPSPNIKRTHTDDTCHCMWTSMNTARRECRGRLRVMRRVCDLGRKRSTLHVIVQVTLRLPDGLSVDLHAELC